MSDWSAEVEEDFERRSQVEFINLKLSKDKRRVIQVYSSRLVLPWTGVLHSQRLLTPGTLPLQEEVQTGAHRHQGVLRGV